MSITTINNAYVAGEYINERRTGGVAGLVGDLVVLAVNLVLASLRELFWLVFPPPLKSLAGEVVLVTGAGHGLGRELALQFAELGATVACWDVYAEGNATTADIINHRGEKAYAYTCDVSDRGAVLAAAEAVRRKVGAISVAVNNAGVLRYGALLAQSEEDVLAHFRANALAHFWVLQAVLPGMLAMRCGHLVAICSMSGVAGSPGMAAYSSSKFAVRGLMETVREEIRLDPRGLDIHCTCVYPFFVDTGMAKDPHFRFPALFGALPPREAARLVVRAVRANRPELSIPHSLLWADRFNRLLPCAISQLMMDFIRGDTRQCYLDNGTEHEKCSLSEH